MRLPKFVNISEKEKGYLLGLVLGDGYANYNKKDRHYTISFYLNSLKDIDIQEQLLNIINKLNLISKVSKDKRGNVNKIRIYSKILFLYLNEQEIKLYSKIKPVKKEFLIGMISGFIDAEGCVYRGTISIAQKNKRIMYLIEEICSFFKIKYRMKRVPNSPRGFIWRGYFSTSFKYLPHNSRKVMREYGCSS